MRVPFFQIVKIENDEPTFCIIKVIVAWKP
jgi:hypothetical protein